MVTGIPNYVEYRRTLLPIAAKLAALPESALKSLEHPASNYSVGWSHGKERIGGGRADMYKGSFYANPKLDIPTTDPALIRQYPDSASPNIWPRQHLAELEPAFKNLGRLVLQVGRLVAQQCDSYVRQKMPRLPTKWLEAAVSSDAPKSRLLHYFSMSKPLEGSRDEWCKWHNDHGSLTGLTSAMFLRDGDNTYTEIDNPDPEAGLWARTRAGKDVRVVIPRDALAFQIGETSQIMSGGFLKATPHAVAPVRPELGRGISRSTFATFMQPDMTSYIDPPGAISMEKIGIARYRPPMTFGQFSKATVNENY